MDDQESVTIYMTRAEANRIVDLLVIYGDGEEDVHTAENVRYQAKQSKSGDGPTHAHCWHTRPAATSYCCDCENLPCEATTSRLRPQRASDKETEAQTAAAVLERQLTNGDPIIAPSEVWIGPQPIQGPNGYYYRTTLVALIPGNDVRYVRNDLAHAHDAEASRRIREKRMVNERQTALMEKLEVK